MPKAAANVCSRRRSRERAAAAAADSGCGSFDSSAEARRIFESSGPARRSNEAARARLDAARESMIAAPGPKPARQLCH